jgi:hypothetical protein
MDRIGELLRGVIASLAAFLVMGALATAALFAAGAPVNWPFVAAVLAAACGGSTTLSGSLDVARGTVLADGSAHVLPMGVTGPAVLVFGALLLLLPGRRRRMWLRAAGAAVAFAALLAVPLTAGAATVRIRPPVGSDAVTRDLVLGIRPDTGATLIGAGAGFVILVGACWLLTVVPARRTVVTTAALGVGLIVLGGLATVPVLASARPGLAGVALLIGPNAVLAAGLAGLGAPSGIDLDGPVARSLRGAATGGRLPLADNNGSTFVRVVVILILVVLGAAVLASVPSAAGGSRWTRAGRRALVAGGTLGVVMGVLAAAAGGSLDLQVSMLIFRVPVLSLHVGPSIVWAVIAGVLAGLVAGAVGSLGADIRRRPAVEPIEAAVAPTGAEVRW